MEYLKITTDKDMRELVSHGSNDYPLKLYMDNFSDYYNGIIAWHWHDEIEILYVTSGHVTVYTDNEVYTLSENDGVFINSKVIHKFQSSDFAMMPNILFAPEFIAPKGTLLYNNFVLPLIHSGLNALKLSKHIPWQSEILDLLQKLYSEQLSELNVHIIVEKVWNLLFENIEQQLEVPKISAPNRVRTMMEYIFKHYAEKIVLEDIANAANVSKSEALRCFRICLDTPPVSFLIDYRLNKAASDILAGELNITQIAARNGFESAGYFCKMFKRKFNVSPTKYRVK